LCSHISHISHIFNKLSLIFGVFGDMLRQKHCTYCHIRSIYALLARFFPYFPVKVLKCQKSLEIPLNFHFSSTFRLCPAICPRLAKKVRTFSNGCGRSLAQASSDTEHHVVPRPGQQRVLLCRQPEAFC
jgi:hypothetical protein